MGVSIAAGFTGGADAPPPGDDADVEGYQPSPRPWQSVDLGPVLDGTYQPPRPTVGCRSDGTGLFYPGRAHVVVSESEGGKTWFLLSAAVDEMNAGHHVAYLDFEDNEGGIGGRLLVLGVDRDTIRERFHYLRPDAALGTGINLDDLNRVLSEHAPTLVVVDGITEAMTMHGLDPNKNDDAATFGRMLPRRITSTGAAAVSADHVVKDREGRGRWAIGAQHKLSGLDGAQYVLTNQHPFGVGIRGVSKVGIAKDRPGQLRRHALSSAGGLHWFGDLVLDSQGEDFAEVSIEAPVERSDDFRPTVLMARIAVALTKRGPLAQRRIIAAVSGNTESIRRALGYLILDGYVSNSTPHTLLKPYPDGDSDS